MERLFFSMLALALQWFRPRHNVQLQFLEAQIPMLRSRVDVSRIVPTPKEKVELLIPQQEDSAGRQARVVPLSSFPTWIPRAELTVRNPRNGYGSRYLAVKAE